MSHAWGSDRTLVLHRRLLLSAAATAAATRDCLLVYPPGKKSRQRFGVGDTSGNFTVYACTKSIEEGCTTVFSTARGKSSGARRKSNSLDEAQHDESDRRPISCATLYTDQLFVMRGSVLDAYTRKGTAFFHVDTSVTESAHSLVIDTPYIFAAGEFILTTMKESNELGFFLSPDRIRAMTAFPLPYAGDNSVMVSQMEERSVDEYVCCLGCNDRVLRLVQNNKLVKEIGCEAALTALYWDAGQQRLYYGTQSGTLGAFVVSIAPSGSYELVRCMHYLPEKKTTTTASVTPDETDVRPCSAVSCLTCYDVDCDGRVELLVGYEDGTVRVFAIAATTAPQEEWQETGRSANGSPAAGTRASSPPLGLTPNSADGTPHTKKNNSKSATSPHKARVQEELVRLWSGAVEERVMGIAAGIVTGDAAHPDLLVHLFSGAVVCFSFVRAERMRAAAVTPVIALTSPTPGPSLTPVPILASTSPSGTVETMPVAELQPGSMDDAIGAEQEDNNNVTSNAAEAQERRARAARLQAEVDALRAEIQSVTEELTKKSGAAEQQRPLVALAATFRAQVRLSVIEGSPLLALVMESDMPLSHAVLYSALPQLHVEATSSTLVTTVDSSLMATSSDTSHGSEETSGTLVLLQPLSSDTNESGGGGGNSPLDQTDVVRMSDSGDGGGIVGGCKRLEVRLVPRVAQSDLLYVTLYASPQPRTAQVKTVPLPAMPLYTRVNALPEAELSSDEAALVLSSLTFTGEFTLAQVQEQLAQTLPDFPPSLLASAGNATETVMYYRHAFTGEVLRLTFLYTNSNGALVLTCASDSLSSLSTLRRELTSMAVAHRVRLAIEQDIRAVSAFRTLTLLKPIFDRHRRTTRLALLREGLRELQDGSNNNSDTNGAAVVVNEEERIVPASMQSLFLPSEGEDDMSAAQPVSQLDFAKHAVTALLTSLIDFKFYTDISPSLAGQSVTTAAVPTLAALDRLVQSEAGVDVDELVRLFFPHDEHLVERRQLEASEAQRKKAEQDRAAQDEANNRRRSGTSESDMPLQAARMVTERIAVNDNTDLAL